MKNTKKMSMNAKKCSTKRRKLSITTLLSRKLCMNFKFQAWVLNLREKNCLFFWREACTSMFTNVDDRKFSNLCEWGQSRNGINYLFAEIFHLCFYLHSRHTREINQQVVVHSIKRKTFFFFSFFNYFLRETIKRDNLDVLMQSKHAFFIRSSKNRVSERIMSTWFMLEKDMS